MNAKQVMTRPVISVAPSTKVADVARIFIEQRISACPVLDRRGRLVGIVSEADLVPRAQELPDPRGGWWRRLLVDSEVRANDYIRAHGELVRDLMTHDVVSVRPDTPLDDVATALHRHKIRRVPVLDGGTVIGIVSRSDLIRSLTEAMPERPAIPSDARALQRALLAEIDAAGIRTTFLQVGVSDGVIHISGATESLAERRALRLAYQRVAGQTPVDEQVAVLPPAIRSLLWAA